MTDEIKKGLLGIVVDETTISQVMPEINSLTYRGYAVQDLCEMCSFEEVAYLILNGDLPNSIQLNKFKKEERENRNITINLREIVKHMPKKAHPMDVVRTAVSLMALEDKETKDNSPEANMRKAMRIFAKTPAAVAAFFRVRKSKKIIAPNKNNMTPNIKFHSYIYSNEYDWTKPKWYPFTEPFIILNKKASNGINSGILDGLFCLRG